MEIIFATLNENSETKVIYADDFFKGKDGYVYTVETFRVMRNCVKDMFEKHATGNNIIINSTYVGIEDLEMFRELAKKHNLSMLVLDKNGEVDIEYNLPHNLPANELLEAYF